MNTEFDLNAAIQNWRQNLSQSPQFRAENLDELEAHLRDAVVAMQGQRLTDEEIFLIATRRIGGVCALESEFAKVNAREVWLNRALWMLLGIQLWFVLGGLALIVSDLASAVGMIGYGRTWILRPSEFWSTRIAVYSGIAQVGTLVLGVWFCWWLFRRKERVLAAGALQILNRPRLLGLLVAIGFVMLVAIQFAGWFETLLLSGNLSANQLGMMHASRTWASLGTGLTRILALLVCTALLARRLHLRKSHSA